MGISKALVVDDSRLARVALSKMLARRGLEVETAECGTDAIDVLRGGSPDVVFLDYMMPDMDGFQAAEAINRLRGERALPLVMYTSQDTDEDRRRARELGICGFLSKPTSDQGLDAVLEAVSRWRPPEPPVDAAMVPMADLEPVAGQAAAPESPKVPEEPIVADAINEPDAQFVSAYAPEPAQQASGPAAGEPIAPAPDTLPAVAPATPEAATADDEPPPSGVAPAPAPDEAGARRMAEEVAMEVAGALEERLRASLEALDQRWQDRLDRADEHWRDGLRGFGDSLNEAATDAAILAGQQSAERLAAETEQSVLDRVRDMLEVVQSPPPPDTDALEQRLRDAIDRESRELTEERVPRLVREQAQELTTRLARAEAEQVAGRVAGEISSRAAREAAGELVEKAIAEARGDLVAGVGQELLGRAEVAVSQSVQQLSRQPEFQSQLMNLVSEHAVPRLKNQLDHWVEERSRQAVEALVEAHLERSVDAMVQRTVAASARAAAEEADGLHARFRRQVLYGGAALGVGVLLALLLAMF